MLAIPTSVRLQRLGPVTSFEGLRATRASETVRRLPSAMGNTVSSAERLIITRIQVTNVAIGLRRIPVGFYVSVHYDGTDWETANKPATMDTDVTEWDDKIPLPEDMTAILHFKVVASFELTSMLGSGELLRAFSISVKELMNHSNKTLPIVFDSKDSELVSSCSSILITLEQGHSQCRNSVRAGRTYVTASVNQSLANFTDEGQNALLRYRKDQTREDLEVSIEQFSRALDACPSNSPYFPVVMFNLATAKLASCHAHVDTDLDILVTLFRDALNLRPTGHPDRPATLLHLSIALLYRFKKYHRQTDCDEAERFLSQLLELCPSQSYEHRSALVVRGTFDLPTHPAQTSSNSDSNPADSLERNTTYGPDDVENMVMTALSHLERFKESGDMTDLTAAISLLQNAVQFIEDDDPNKLFFLMNLAMSYSMRFEHLQDLSDLNKSISTLDDMIRLYPDDPNKPGFENNLGYLLRTRFEHLGDPADIIKSVSVLEEAIQLTPDGPDTDKPNRLDNLATSLRTRFDCLGDPADIQKSISIVEDAIRLTPNGHPHKARALCTLATALKSRFERLGDMVDIERSITLFEECLHLTPSGHPDQANRFNSFGGALLRRFQRVGDIRDIHKSISVLDDAVRLTPDGHAFKPTRVANLGYSLSVRFDRLGDPADMQKSISLLEDAIQLTHNNLSKAVYMGNLSGVFTDRFEHSGDVADIDKAVSLCEEATDLIPHGHQERRLHLENLSRSLWRRYRHLDNQADLQRAIVAIEDAIKLAQDGHARKPLMLSSLGVMLLNRFELSGDRSDLDRAVSWEEEACSLIPQDHANKPALLSNLGTAYSMRFDNFGEHADVQHAVSRYEQALQMLPRDHPYKAGFLNNLSEALSIRFQRLDDLADIDKAISLLEESIHLTPDSLPSWSLRHQSLSRSLILRYNRLGESADLEKALSSCSIAALSTAGTSEVRFNAAQIWITVARMLSRNPIEAYSTAIDLLPRLAWMGLPIKDRHLKLLDAANVARDAAAAALDIGRTQTAIEWLEQGRAIVWSQLLQLRNPLDELRRVHPTLADQLYRVSNELEKASAGGDPLAGLEEKHDLGDMIERQARRHRALAKERERLLAEVRSLRGFERFLLPKTFDELTAAARSGPVVILNASRLRCDAVVVRENPDDLVHIPLSDLTYEYVGSLEIMLSKVLGSSGREVEDTDRGARLSSRRSPEDSFKHILSELWRSVVKPVLDKLGFLIPGGELHRIFWCPTGPFAFLPIHAAALYNGRTPGVKASDFVVSSYTPTLDALMSPVEAPSSHLQIAVVPQPESDGQLKLPGTRTEIDQLHHIIETYRASPTTVTLVKSIGTVEDVLEKMTTSTWVHFACHGIQDRRYPLASGLMLADRRRLTLVDIVRLSRPRGGLAFLSACQTGRGEEALPEEAIHLAAGMLLVGYSSVIATMWSIGDSDAPEVTKGVYEQLFREGEIPDVTRAARALHDAVERLRQRGAPFISWVPFIHVGL